MSEPMTKERLADVRDYRDQIRRGDPPKGKRRTVPIEWLEAAERCLADAVDEIDRLMDDDDEAAP